jgi:hypothetical protein
MAGPWCDKPLVYFLLWRHFATWQFFSENEKKKEENLVICRIFSAIFWNKNN